MTNDKTSKYNTIMPESKGKTLCIEITKPISEEGYKENFLPKIRKIIEEYGEIHLLTYYKNYQGWEEQATTDDMQTIVEYGKYFTKIAMVNPPGKEIFRSKVKTPLLPGELRFFNEDELEDAIAWVKED